MVFDTIGGCEFDTLWIWGYDFDMVLLCFWYGLGYGLDMVWERSAFFRVPDGLASRKDTETAPGQPFGRFLEVFCSCWYDFDTILIRFWHDFDTIPIWCWYDFGYGSNGLASNHNFDPHQES